MRNLVYNNGASGIACVNASGDLIQFNRITSNRTGIQYNNSTDTVSLNSVTNNTYGLVYINGDTTGITRNNLAPNLRYALSNVQGLNRRMTNNWWGGTIASNIRKKSSGRAVIRISLPIGCSGFLTSHPTRIRIRRKESAPSCPL